MRTDQSLTGSKAPDQRSDRHHMEASPALLSGRLTRQTVSWVLIAIIVVSPGEAFSSNEPLILWALPVRLVILFGILGLLHTKRINPVTTGRLILVIGLLTMFVWAFVSQTPPDRVALEASAYGTILPIFALLVAPKPRRRWWALVVVGIVLVSAAVRLLPEDSAVLFQTFAILFVHSTAVLTPDTYASRAEVVGEMASYDVLTGLFNRRPMIARLGSWAGVDQRQPEATASVLMLDIDNFKLLNDTMGHDAGDRALQQVATSLTSAVRIDDVVCRWGGEEFLVLLPRTDEAAAVTVAESLRRAVTEGGITASVGVAEARSTETVTEWISRADHAMYQAKQCGRDQVCAASSLPVENPADEPVV